MLGWGLGTQWLLSARLPRRIKMDTGAKDSLGLIAARFTSLEAKSRVTVSVKKFPQQLKLSGHWGSCAGHWKNTSSWGCQLSPQLASVLWLEKVLLQPYQPKVLTSKSLFVSTLINCQDFEILPYLNLLKWSQAPNQAIIKFSYMRIICSKIGTNKIS